MIHPLVQLGNYVRSYFMTAPPLQVCSYNVWTFPAFFVGVLLGMIIMFLISLVFLSVLCLDFSKPKVTKNENSKLTKSKPRMNCVCNAYQQQINVERDETRSSVILNKVETTNNKNQTVREMWNSVKTYPSNEQRRKMDRKAKRRRSIVRKVKQLDNNQDASTKTDQSQTNPSSARYELGRRMEENEAMSSRMFSISKHRDDKHRWPGEMANKPNQSEDSRAFELQRKLEREKRRKKIFKKCQHSNKKHKNISSSSSEVQSNEEKEQKHRLEMIINERIEKKKKDTDKNRTGSFSSSK